MGNVDVILILFITLKVRSGKIVTDRLNLFNLLLPHAIRCVLRDKVELARDLELRERCFTLNLGCGQLFAFCSYRRWLPARLLAYELLSGVGRFWSTIGYSARPVIDRE